MGNLEGKKSKASRPVGSGRGVRGGGTADKLGRTSEEQSHDSAKLRSKANSLASTKAPKFAGLAKRRKK